MNKTWRIPSYSDVSCSGCRPDFLHCHLNKNNSNRDSVFILSQSWSPVTPMLMNEGGGPSRAEQILDSVTRPSCVATRHDGRLRGGADKFLARPTSRCKTESIVSLERGVSSCAELQILLKRLKKACQATYAISTTSRRELSSGPPSPQGKAPKEIHAILTETLGEHATVKNWVTQFKRRDFSTCDAPRPGRPKTVTTPEIIDQIHKLMLEDRRI